MQSLTAAGVCVVVDAAVFVLQEPGPVNAALVISFTAIVVVDLALAGPPRLSGVVAVAHAVVQFAVPLLLAAPQTIFVNDTGMLIAGYRAGAWLVGTSAYLALAALLAATVVSHSTSVGSDDVRSLPVMLIVSVAGNGLLPWLVGRYTTSRGAAMAELEQRAELERRDAQEALTRMIAAERSAIARDLHDVIAHHVSTINLHAGAARLGLDPHDRALSSSLHAVETASRAAMVDLRHLLDLLHGDQPDDTRQPGLADLDRLLDGVRAAGVPVTLTTSTAMAALPESLGVALYRIMQEMLTNALRHGDRSGVRVALSVRDGRVHLDTTNGMAARPDAADGDGAVGAGPGRGLEGIRTRACVFGGVTTAGPERDGRTWCTAVAIPLQAS